LIKFLNSKRGHSAEIYRRIGECVCGEVTNKEGNISK